jgi:hypothetical protein
LDSSNYFNKLASILAPSAQAAVIASARGYCDTPYNYIPDPDYIDWSDCSFTPPPSECDPDEFGIISGGSQTIQIDGTPQDILANISGAVDQEQVRWNFEAGGTGLTGSRSGNAFSFTSAATGVGTATLTITDLEDDRCVAVATIEVSQQPQCDPSQFAITSGKDQVIQVNGTPTNITANISGALGEEVEWTFNPGTTGLTGSGSGNAFSFTSAATSTGTATVTLTDPLDADCSDTATIEITAAPQCDPSQFTITSGKDQVIQVNGTPTNITANISGAIDQSQVQWTLEPGETGLNGSGSGNTFTFTSAATRTGTATVTLRDLQDNDCVAVATIEVSQQPQCNPAQFFIETNQSQEIEVDEVPENITAEIEGALGEVTWTIDPDDTGLDGSGSGELFDFNNQSPATDTGIATITVTDTEDADCTATAQVIVSPKGPEQCDPDDFYITTDDQEVEIGETPDDIRANIDGALGEVEWEINPRGTGLDGDGEDDRFDFDSDAEETGTATITLIDTEDASCHDSVEVEVEDDEDDEDCESTIGDYVWYDEDGDGRQDSDEEGLDDITLTLYDYHSGDRVDRENTDSDGDYLFDDLCEDEYRVKVDMDDVRRELGNCVVETYAKPYVDLDENEDYREADFGYDVCGEGSPETGPAFNIILVLGISFVLTFLTMFYLSYRKQKHI